VDGDGHGGAQRHLGHASSSQLGLSLLAHVDVAVDLRSSAAVDDVLRDLIVADDGGIMLAWGDRRAVTGNRRVDWTGFIDADNVYIVVDDLPKKPRL
jgi:hypothetical protein